MYYISLMRVIPQTLEINHSETISLYGLGDIHLGHKGFEEEVLDEVLEIMKQDERQKRYIFMGDYANNFPKQDKRNDIRVEDRRFSSALKSYSYIRDKIQPYANDTLCLLEGNHDMMWHKAENEDFTSWLCTEIRSPYAPYCTMENGTYEAGIRLRFKRKHNLATKIVKIIAWHGLGGGRTKGGAVNVLAKPSLVFPYAQIFLMGHLHRHGVVTDNVLDFDDKNSFKVERYFAFTGGFLDGYPEDISTYVSRKMLPPMGTGAVKLNITPFHGKYEKLRVTWEKIP